MGKEKDRPVIVKVPYDHFIFVPENKFDTAQAAIVFIESKKAEKEGAAKKKAKNKTKKKVKAMKEKAAAWPPPSGLTGWKKAQLKQAFRKVYGEDPGPKLFACKTWKEWREHFFEQAMW